MPRIIVLQRQGLKRWRGICRTPRPTLLRQPNGLNTSLEEHFSFVEHINSDVTKAYQDALADVQTYFVATMTSQLVIAKFSRCIPLGGSDQKSRQMLLLTRRPAKVFLKPIPHIEKRLFAKSHQCLLMFIWVEWGLLT